MEKMNKATATTVMAAIAEAVKEKAAALGLTMKPGVACKYSTVGLTLKFELFVAGGQQERERDDFAQLAILYGLKPSDYLRKLTLIGENYLLVGFRPRSSKRPILVKRIFDAKLFTFPAKAVESLRAEQSGIERRLADAVATGLNTGK